MPLYEYACPQCGQKQEVLVRSTEAAAAPSCPECRIVMDKAWATFAAHAASGGSGGGCSQGGCASGGFS